MKPCPRIRVSYSCTLPFSGHKRGPESKLGTGQMVIVLIAYVGVANPSLGRPPSQRGE